MERMINQLPQPPGSYQRTEALLIPFPKDPHRCFSDASEVRGVSEGNI